MNSILIVEDDKALSNGIALALQGEDTLLVRRFDIASARAGLAAQGFDLIILDINLPDGNGLDFLPECKQKAAVILLTANDLETDIVTGLELGADDYITKPFSLAVLRARVNTQLRKRDQARLCKSRYEQSGFIFDFDRMEFFKSTDCVELSKTEQKLLKVLIDNKGVTLKRETLIDRLWTDGAQFVDENALSVTIKRLRDKLEDVPSSPKHIRTVYGIGYVWTVE